MEAIRTPCDHDACVEESGDFARLRYFFGQRLSAVDLADEQSYLVGKHRFHQRYLHGMGVLCGLTAERSPPVQGDDGASTVLRVRRGAAIDCHGREIVVGSDHCIDVAAWFGRERARLPDEWKTAGDHAVWIVVRFQDCPSDPVLAPRDPCGCTAKSCEYARVREGFELALRTTLEDTCTEATDPAAAFRELTGKASPDCPECGGDCPGWLALARVDVTIATTREGAVYVADVADPGNAIAERIRLLPTRTLQALVAATLPIGPALGAPVPSGTPDSAVLTLPVKLLDDDDGEGVALAKDSAVAVELRVETIDGDGVAAVDGTTSFDEDAAAFVWTADAAASLDEGHTYRLRVVEDPDQPLVDRELRPLSVLGRTVRFRAGTANGGTLAITLF